MRTYGLVAIILFVGVTVAGAQQVDPAEFEALQAQVEALSQQGNDLGCYDTCSDPCCRPAGFFAGAELCYMEANVVNGVFGVPFDFEAASRFWLGYSRSDGLGLQARVWDFDHTASAGVRATRLDLNVFDLELTNAMELSYYWDALLTAGYRHVEYREGEMGLVEEWFLSSNDGLTVSGELRRQLRGNLTLFGNARASAIFGDDITRVGQQATVNRNTAKYMWENQLGIEWRRPLNNGGSFFVRGAAEVQYWNGFITPIVLNGILGTHDGIAMVGGTFAMGIQR